MSSSTESIVLGSGFFWCTEARRKVAQSVIREITGSGTWRSPIVTEVKPLANDSTAEACHQGYCAFVVGPKVEKFQKTLASKVKR